MTASVAAHSLLLFAGWTGLLVSLTIAYRVVRFLTGTRINAWPRDKPNTADPAFITRLGHAHLNAVESLPVFAAIVVAAHVTGKLALVDAIAPYVFYARVGQSLAHLSGGGQLNVFVRAGFFSAQLGALMYLVWALL